MRSTSSNAYSDMHIPLTPDTTIYVVVSSNVTGGPRDLHKLAYDLRALYKVKNVLMYYIAAKSENPIPAPYAHYNVDYAREIEDDEKNVLIIPEIYTHRFVHLRRITKVIYWLSVDNYYLSKDYFARHPLMGRINKLIFKLGSSHYLWFERELKDIPYHLAQGYYVYDHLRKKGVKNVFYLINHIEPKALEQAVDISMKKDIVAYTPRRGYAFTKKIIDASPDMAFVPIINMSYEQMVAVLKEAKVFLDFGHHPGKDQMPRESAILGCCVITGRRGAAKFFEDIAIPEDCKFTERSSDIPKIREKIQSFLRNYKNETKRFDAYREKTRGEREVHLACLHKIFSFTLSARVDSPVV